MVNGFYNEIIQVKPEAPIIIVGTHADWEDSREVTKEEAESLASDLHCEYYETSPYTYKEVERAFNSLITKIVHSIPQNPSSNPSVEKHNNNKHKNNNRETCLI